MDLHIYKLSDDFVVQSRVVHRHLNTRIIPNNRYFDYDLTARWKNILTFQHKLHDGLLLFHFSLVKSFLKLLFGSRTDINIKDATFKGFSDI